MAIHRIKAYGGNRAKNLESIADNIDKLLIPTANAMFPLDTVVLNHLDAHKIRGYMEQLRIIANEISSMPSAKAVTEPNEDPYEGPGGMQPRNEEEHDAEPFDGLS